MNSAHPNGGSILVTGATGLAGSAIVREFIRAGHPVRVLVRNPTRATALRAFPTVEVVEGDLLRHCCIERSAHSSWSHLPAQKPHGRARMPGLSWVLHRDCRACISA